MTKKLKLVIAVVLLSLSLPTQAYSLNSWVAPGFAPNAAQPVTHWSRTYISLADSWIFTEVEINTTYTNDDANIILGPISFLFPITGAAYYSTNFINVPRADYWDAFFQTIMIIAGVPVSDLQSENDFHFMFPAFGGPTP